MNQTRTPEPDSQLEWLLGELGMATTLVEVELGDGAVKESFSLRIVVPKAPDWMERIANLPWMERVDPGLLWRLYGLLLLCEIGFDPKRKYGRQIGAEGVWRTPGIRAGLKELRAVSSSLSEVIRLLAQDSGEEDEELLDKALYTQSIPREEWLAAAYGDFSELVLSELIEYRENLESGPLGRKAMHKVGVENQDDPRWQGALEEAWPRVLRLIYGFASAEEAQRGGTLESIGASAEDLLRRAEQAGETGSGVEPPDISEVDQVIREALEHLKTLTTLASDWKRECITALQIGLKPEAGMEEKIDILMGLAVQFRDRTALVEMLRREADAAPAFVFSRAMREVYRRLRQHLTLPERRLFALTWFSEFPRIGTPEVTLPFNGFSLRDLPFFSSLVSDTELVVLTIAALGFKRRTLGSEDLPDILHRAYRKHVAFYAWWAPLVRFEDAERKRSKRRRRCEVQPPEKTDFEDREVWELQASWRRALVEKVTALGEGTRKREVATRYFVKSKTQTEIACELGITQQAVSKTLRGLYGRLGAECGMQRPLRNLMSRGKKRVVDVD